MLSATTAATVAALARACAEEAAERFLVQGALLQADLAPPKDGRERSVWEERQVEPI
jgi:hypothetical protein